MNALMTISISGATAMGEWAEAGVVVTLFALANFLEARSLDRPQGHRRPVRVFPGNRRHPGRESEGGNGPSPRKRFGRATC
jgi:hypothetical protein